MNKDHSTHSLKEQRPLVALAQRVKTILTRIVILVICPLSLLLTPSCNPEAHWVDDDVNISMNVKTVSAGFIECSFSTDMEAYYLIAIQPAEQDFDPMTKQKQFMTLALDSANLEYLNWRNWLLQAGEFNIAPFASHALQYGDVDHFFTNLKPDTEYWIYAFTVNPETLKPNGKLHLTTVKTTKEGIFDVHFEYRVRGIWDYIYPLNPDGNINNHFPYLAGTIDSLTLDEAQMGAEEYFVKLFKIYSEYDLNEVVRYGVQVAKNDGWNSDEMFQEGHTYYTAIASYDGFFGNNVLYKFTWTGENFQAYFTDEDNIASFGENE